MGDASAEPPIYPSHIFEFRHMATDEYAYFRVNPKPQTLNVFEFRHIATDECAYFRVNPKSYFMNTKRQAF